jgi:hypothetical protein
MFFRASGSALFSLLTSASSWDTKQWPALEHFEVVLILGIE